MNVIIHYPESEDGMKVLQDKVSVVHSEYVLKYIQNMTCPKEQKLKLIGDIEKQFELKKSG